MASQESSVITVIVENALITEQQEDRISTSVTALDMYDSHKLSETQRLSVCASTVL